MRALTVLAAMALLVAGCGGEGQEIDPSLDPTPTKLDGSESAEFDEEHLEAASNAGGLVELYCDGAVSDAQELGCLSHVSEADVCAQDTSGKQSAVREYIALRGEAPC